MHENTQGYAAYRDVALSIEERVEDLLSRMTTEEKVMQLSLGGGIMGGLNPMIQDAAKKGAFWAYVDSEACGAREFAKNINQVVRWSVKDSRLGIPIAFQTPCDSGCNQPTATVFASGIGNTWDPTLIEAVFDKLRVQIRSTGVSTIWYPQCELGRDPRTAHDCLSEDPTLCAALATAQVRGLRGNDFQDGVSALANNFIGSVSAEGAINRRIRIDERQLREEYCKPYAACIEEGLQQIDVSPSERDGIPLALDHHLMKDILVDEMGFRGVIWVSALGFFDSKETTASIIEKLANNGCTQQFEGRMLPEVLNTLKSGEIQESDLDQMVRNVLTLKYKLGLFENPYANEKLVQQYINDPQFDTLSRKLCAESVVLTKNNGILPLSNDYRNIAVIGPNADSIRNMFNGYSYPAHIEFTSLLLEGAKKMGEGAADMLQEVLSASQDADWVAAREEELRKQYGKTILEHLREKLPQIEVRYAKGCGILDATPADLEEAVSLAASSDLAILVVGGKGGSTYGCTTGEGVSPADIRPHGGQYELLSAVEATGTPVIILNVDNCLLSAPEAVENASAVLECGFPGQFGPDVITDILLGQINPSGHLSRTIPKHVGQMPIYFGLPRSVGYGRKDANGMGKDGYSDFTFYPEFYFGHGLSYTTFYYSDLRLSTHEAAPHAVVDIFVTVTNTGSRPGDEIVQLYFSDKTASVVRPARQLGGFCRVSLEVGEHKTLVFHFHTNQLSFLDAGYNWIIEPGTVDILIGASSEDIRLQDSFVITGETTASSSHRQYYCIGEEV